MSAPADEVLFERWELVRIANRLYDSLHREGRPPRFIGR